MEPKFCLQHEPLPFSVQHTYSSSSPSLNSSSVTSSSHSLSCLSSKKKPSQLRAAAEAADQRGGGEAPRRGGRGDGAMGARGASRRAALRARAERARDATHAFLKMNSLSAVHISMPSAFLFSSAEHERMLPPWHGAARSATAHTVAHRVATIFSTHRPNRNNAGMENARI